MLQTRVVPCLLLKGEGLVKTERFGSPRYVGDPINVVRILNEKEVDELFFLDIQASRDQAEPNHRLIEAIASEAFMPLGYGGGVRDAAQVGRLLACGVEKVVLNSAAIGHPDLVEAVSREAGSQSVVVSIDVKRDLLGRYSVWTHGGTRNARLDPVECAREAESAGAGEILLTAIDRDGTRAGYDLALIERVAAAVGIPVVASGGAGKLADFRAAVDRGASAVAAGSLFVFHGKHRAVLVTYPKYGDLEQLFGA